MVKAQQGLVDVQLRQVGGVFQVQVRHAFLRVFCRKMPNYIGGASENGNKRIQADCSGRNGLNLPDPTVAVLRHRLIPGQVDVFPAQRREIPQQHVINTLAVVTHSVYHTLQLDGIPKNDSCRH